MITKSTKTKKKVQWRPAKLLDTISGLDEENFAYRWVDKDPANLMKKRAEGWEVINTLQGDNVSHQRPGNLVDGGEMTPSLTEYRDLIMMKIPKEQAEARKEYYEEITESQVQHIEEQTNENIRSAGSVVHGDIRELSDLRR